MSYHSFEDLDVWKRAIDLSVKIYGLLRECRDYGFKDQICRASVSVPSNIAEGMERHSVNETVHFLHIAKGSCAEVRTQLIIAARIGYITKEQLKLLTTEAVSISKMLHSLAVSLTPNT
jgi:four helix bundle protein